MDQSSRLRGPLPVQPPSGGVIRARKKSRPEDRKGENRKKDREDKDEKELQEATTVHIEERARDAEVPAPHDEPVEYGPRAKKRRSQKIDLVI